MIGHDDQLRRIGKRLVVREQFGINVFVQADDGQIFHTEIKLVREAAHLGIGIEETKFV